MGVIVTRANVEDFMSSPVVRDTYDDNGDGNIDSGALEQIIELAEGMFFATIRGIYELPLVAPVDPFAKHVVLQLVHCQSIRRFPERFRNGLKVCEHVKELLTDIRKGNLKLDHPLKSDGRGPVADSLPGRCYEALEMGHDDD